MARRIPPRHQNQPKIRVKVKVKKDDTVKVIAGRDRGKTGRVLQVDAVKGKVLIEGVSLVKRHTRPNPQKQIKGGIAEQESPIHISNVALVCPNCGVARVAMKTDGDARVRYCKKCGQTLPTKK